MKRCKIFSILLVIIGFFITPALQAQTPPSIMWQQTYGGTNWDAA